MVQVPGQENKRTSTSTGLLKYGQDQLEDKFKYLSIKEVYVCQGPRYKYKHLSNKYVKYNLSDQDSSA